MPHSTNTARNIMFLVLIFSFKPILLCMYMYVGHVYGCEGISMAIDLELWGNHHLLKLSSTGRGNFWNDES